MPIPLPASLKAFDDAVSSLHQIEAEHKDFAVNGSFRCSREDIGMPYSVFLSIFYPVMRELWRQQDKWNQTVRALESGEKVDTSEFTHPAPSAPGMAGMMGMGMGMMSGMMPGLPFMMAGPTSPMGMQHPTAPIAPVGPRGPVGANIDPERPIGVGPVGPSQRPSPRLRNTPAFCAIDQNGNVLLDTLRHSVEASQAALQMKLIGATPESLAAYPIKPVTMSYEP